MRIGSRMHERGLCPHEEGLCLWAGNMWIWGQAVYMWRWVLVCVRVGCVWLLWSECGCRSWLSPRLPVRFSVDLREVWPVFEARSSTASCLAQPAFLHHPGPPTYLGVALPTVGWAHPHHSLIKKMQHGFAYRQIGRRCVLNLSFLLPSGHHLCQVDRKPMSTVRLARRHFWALEFMTPGLVTEIHVYWCSVMWHKASEGMRPLCLPERLVSSLFTLGYFPVAVQEL